MRVETKLQFLATQQIAEQQSRGDSLIKVTTAMLHLYLFSTAIFMLTALLNLLLTACLLPSRGLAAQDFLLLILILSIYLMQELTSIFTPSSLTLVNSGTLFLCLFQCFSTCLWLKLFQKRSVKTEDTSHTKLDLTPMSIFLLLSSLQDLATSGIFFILNLFFP